MADQTLTHKQRKAANTKRWRERNKEKVAAYKAASKEKMSRYQKEYSERNKERISQSAKLRYERNRENILAKQTIYNRTKDHKSAKSAYDKQYHERNKLRRSAERKQYWESNKKKILSKMKRYYELNAAMCSQSHKRWRMQNKDKVNAYNAIRRSRELSVSIGDQNLVAAFYKLVHEAPRMKCYWCNKSVKKPDRQVDHIVPVSKGGPHHVDNLCCACSRCNHEKLGKMPEDFAPQGVLRFI